MITVNGPGSTPLPPSPTIGQAYTVIQVASRPGETGSVGMLSGFNRPGSFYRVSGTLAVRAIVGFTASFFVDYTDINGVFHSTSLGTLSAPGIFLIPTTQYFVQAHASISVGVVLLGAGTALYDASGVLEYITPILEP